MIMALMLAPLWLRPPATWTAPAADAATVATSLINHLFVKYPVPPILYRALDLSAWGVPDPKPVAWLVLLGRGANLRRLGLQFGWHLPRGFLEWLFRAPATLSFGDGLLWSAIMRLGGSQLEFDRIRRCPGLNYDPTGLGMVIRVHDCPSQYERIQDQTHPDADFLQRTIVWLVRHREELTDEISDAVLDWSAHLHLEHQRGRGAPFSWSGRRPGPAYATAMEYLATLARSEEALAWSSHGWDWQVDEFASRWALRELLSSSQLSDEGRRMRHCVGSYGWSCARGHAAVFSLSRGGTNVLTVEVNPHDRTIVQAQGVANCRATAEQRAVLARWLREVVNPEAKYATPFTRD